tara:strand:- start:15390 stop:16574 length:1185 start_codon:yes stop_codon:yes gene_type:complete
MKICIAGKNDIAVNILIYALNYFEPNQICVVLNKSDISKNTWQKSLGFYANLYKIEILELSDVMKFNDLIFLSLEFDKIVEPKKFQTSRIFNIHFSLLPEYKGMYTSLLPILHGKKFSGVSLHKIDRGIDTGDIIDQKQINIEGFTCEELYLKYIEEGTELLIKNFENLISNKYNYFIQPSINSTYFSKKSFDFTNIEINPYQTAYQISQFVKATDFSVYQMPTFQGLEMYKSRITATKSTIKPGSVIISNDEYIEIATIDFNVILYKDYFKKIIEYSQTNNFIKATEIIDLIPDLEKMTKEGWNLLIIACYNGSREMVKLLLNNNVNPRAKNLNGTTALMYAKDSFLLTRDIEIIEMLLDKGARVDETDIYNKSIFDYLNDEELTNYLNGRNN